MPRVKRGVQARAKHKKVLAKAKGYYGARRKVYRVAKQAVTNVLRKKGRLALTWLTLTLAAGAFMGIFGVFVSINQTIGDVFDSFNAQIIVTPNERQDFEHVRELALAGVAGIEAIDPGIGLSVELEGYVSPDNGTSQLQMTGLDPTSDSMRLDIRAGTAWEDDPRRAGLVLTQAVARPLNNIRTVSISSLSVRPKRNFRVKPSLLLVASRTGNGSI